VAKVENMKKIIYNPSALHDHPAFEELRAFISRDPSSRAKRPIGVFFKSYYGHKYTVKTHV